MILVVGIGRGDAGEQILIVFAGQQVAIAQRVLAEFGQQGIARLVGDDIEGAGIDGLAVALGDGHRHILVGNVAASRKIHILTPSLARHMLPLVLIMFELGTEAPSLAQKASLEGSF